MHLRLFVLTNNMIHLEAQKKNFFNNSVKNVAVITVILGFFPFKTDNNFILTPSLHSEEVFEFLTTSQVVFLNNEVLHV